MLVASSAYRGTARLRETSEGRVLLQEPPKRLVSVGVSAAAAAIERRRLQEVAARENGIVRVESADVFPAQVLETLKRRRLPYEAEDVELLLDLGASTMRPDRVLARSFETLSFGVAAARHLLGAEPGAPTVIAALERAASAVDELGSGVNGNAESVRRRIRALLAANVPGGLLDLSIIDPRDGWAELASEALRRESEAWSGTQELLALLAAATRPRPTKAWRRTSAGLAASHPGYGDLLSSPADPAAHDRADVVRRPLAADVAPRTAERGARARCRLGYGGRRRAMGHAAARSARASVRRAIAASRPSRRPCHRRSRAAPSRRSPRSAPLRLGQSCGCSSARSGGATC